LDHAVKLVPETRYARTTDGVYIAYQTVGEGPDVVIGFNADESNVDLMWDEPDWRPFLVGTAEFGRLILHDRRAVGASSRNVPPPNLETQVADLLTVLDAVGAEQPLLAGSTPGGQMHALFAATHPNRVQGLVWNNPVARSAWAPDYPWGEGPDAFEESMRSNSVWGTDEYARDVAISREAERRGVPLEAVHDADLDRQRLNVYARIVRNTATPDVAEAINRIQWATDVRAILPAVSCPAALITGRLDNMDEAEYVASLMPNATLHVLEGRSGLAVKPILEIMRQMAGVEPAPAGLDTVLSTVLFTDIVGSTERQAAIGDRAWKQLIESHHAIVRESLTRWRGVENDTAGDGFYATFDGPARAVRCALQVVERVADLGIDVRAGVHTGECEVVDGKATGITVTIGSRICSTARPAEVRVSQTVKDLVAGSGLSFTEVGEHELKGVPDRWRLYRVTG
jgi:class 3 adenylate cyclase/pimeloyl-ACP methyl ester carboxylesterase